MARWTLIDAGVARGRNGLVSSRKPDNIPAFNKKMIEQFGEGLRGGHRIHEPIS